MPPTNTDHISTKAPLTSLRDALLFVAIFCITLAICIWATVRFRKDQIESDLRIAATNALSQNGFKDLVEVSFDHLDATLRGQVQTSSEKIEAGQVVKNVKGVRPVVQNLIEVIDKTSSQRKPESHLVAQESKQPAKVTPAPSAQPEATPTPRSKPAPTPRPEPAPITASVTKRSAAPAIAPKVPAKPEKKEEAASSSLLATAPVISGPGPSGALFSQAPVTLDRFSLPGTPSISLADDPADSAMTTTLPVPPPPGRETTVSSAPRSNRPVAREELSSRTANPESPLAPRSVNAQLKLYPVFFLSGSASIPSRESSKIDQTMALLEKSDEGTHYAVIGVSDGKGDPQKNQELALKRAAAVRDQLITRGISPARLKLKSLIKIAEDGTSSDGWKNRKVELSVMIP